MVSSQQDWYKGWLAKWYVADLSRVRILKTDSGVASRSRLLDKAAEGPASACPVAGAGQGIIAYPSDATWRLRPRESILFCIFLSVHG